MKKSTICLIIMGVLSITAIGVSGYLIYDVFARQNEITEQSIEELDISGVNLENSKITEESVNEFSNIVSELGNIISNETMILNDDGKIISSNKTRFLKQFNPYFLNKNEVSKIGDILDDIHKEPYRKIEGMTLVGIGKAIYDNKEVGLATVDINSVGDILGYKIQRIKLFFNDDNKIISIEKDGEIFEQANTTTPFSSNAIVNVDTNTEFLKELEVLLKKIKDDNVYEKIINGEMELSSNLFNSYIDTLNIKDKNQEVIFDLLNTDPNNFKNVAIVEYQLKDIDVSGISTYVISISNKGKIKSFKVDFNRATNKLTNIY